MGFVGSSNGEDSGEKQKESAYTYTNQMQKSLSLRYMCKMGLNSNL